MSELSAPFVIRPGVKGTRTGAVNRVTACEAGWEWLNIEMRRLRRGEDWRHHTGNNELALVLLGGRCSVDSNVGRWKEIGLRDDVFSGMPHALYLPRNTEFHVTPESEVLEFAYCWAATDQDHPARLISPEDCAVELRGGHNASRQINSIISPGFDCHRLVCVEVYTPGGNWSSYPPHKHDQHKGVKGEQLKEADLEEIYFYKFKRPEGFAFQRIYTDDRSLDEAVVAHNNDIVLVPEGYHPVCTAYGYDCYYPNFLAGSAQSLAASDDPDHAWVKSTWDSKDARVPMVTAATLETLPAIFRS